MSEFRRRVTYSMRMRQRAKDLNGLLVTLDVPGFTQQMVVDEAMSVALLRVFAEGRDRIMNDRKAIPTDV